MACRVRGLQALLHPNLQVAVTPLAASPPSARQGAKQKQVGDLRGLGFWV